MDSIFKTTAVYLIHAVGLDREFRDIKMRCVEFQFLILLLGPLRWGKYSLPHTADLASSRAPPRKDEGSPEKMGPSPSSQQGLDDRHAVA